jgi:hypothetical protein
MAVITVTPPSGAGTGLDLQFRIIWEPEATEGALMVRGPKVCLRLDLTEAMVEDEGAGTESSG